MLSIKIQLMCVYLLKSTVTQLLRIASLKLLLRNLKFNQFFWSYRNIPVLSIEILWICCVQLLLTCYAALPA